MPPDKVKVLTQEPETVQGVPPARVKEGSGVQLLRSGWGHPIGVGDPQTLGTEVHREIAIVLEHHLQPVPDLHPKGRAKDPEVRPLLLVLINFPLGEGVIRVLPVDALLIDPADPVSGRSVGPDPAQVLFCFES